MKVIYAHTYQPGPMFKAESGEWKRITILNLQTIKTHGVELTELATPEEAMALIEKSDVQMVNFGLYGLPRHPVPVTHKKLGQYVRRMFRSLRLAERDEAPLVKPQPPSVKAGCFDV